MRYRFSRIFLPVFVTLISFRGWAETKQVVTALVQVRDRILLLKRAPSEDLYSGFFSLPGGRVDQGESPIAAVQRELKEETGLIGEVVGIYNFWGWTSVIAGKSVNFEVTSFRMRIAGHTDVTLSEEHTAYTWSTAEELAGVQITPELREDVMIGLGLKSPDPETCARLLMAEGYANANGRGGRLQTTIK